MDALFTLLACCLASIGARDQMLLAALTRSQGWRWELVAAALIVSTGACTIAGALVHEVAGELTHPARLVVAAMALGLAGGESLLRRARQAPEEPTYALVPAMVVLLAGQITDSSRFLVLAFAIATEEPLPAVAGGAVGSGMALLFGALYARECLEHRARLTMVRRLAGVLLLLAALGLVAWTVMVVARS